MLAALLVALACPAAPQQPWPAQAAAAVAVRGEPELSAAEALASARLKVEAHVREAMSRRAAHAVDAHRPFWLPAPLAEQTVRRWLADLPTDRVVRLVDREDRQREHEFGSSFQTTLWVAEEPRQVQEAERRLRADLRRLERSALARLGGTVAVWFVLSILVGWLDRLSRGYMTTRLRLSGVLAAVVVPACFFLL